MLSSCESSGVNALSKPANLCRLSGICDRFLFFKMPCGGVAVYLNRENHSHESIDSSAFIYLLLLGLRPTEAQYLNLDCEKKYGPQRGYSACKVETQKESARCGVMVAESDKTSKRYARRGQKLGTKEKLPF